jgi:hypothetical protein
MRRIRASSAASQTETSTQIASSIPFDVAPGAEGETVSGIDMAVVLLIAGMVIFFMSCWRQIVTFVLFIILTVFCIGVYYIIRHLHI